MSRRELAAETLAILNNGFYETVPLDPEAEPLRVDLEDLFAQASEGTQFFTEDAVLALGGMAARVEEPAHPTIEVTQESTLDAAWRLSHCASSGEAVCVLNFASAKNPGGGFLTGAEAQEESLARSSGLYACLEPHRKTFYALSREDNRDGLYHHAMLYSPRVPFFRDSHGNLLVAPWCASVVTSAAVNAGVAARRAEAASMVEQTMLERIRRILRLCQLRCHTALVLGAFGCGVFKNDPAVVAKCFGHWLGHPDFAGIFSHVVFAVCGPPQHPNFIAFREEFLGKAPRAALALDPLSDCPPGSAGAESVLLEAQHVAPEKRWRAARGKRETQRHIVRDLATDSGIGSASTDLDFDFLAVVGFEATSEDGQQSMPQEIIEFPIVLVDCRKCFVEAEFHTYVRPVHKPERTQLTGITHAQVDAAPAWAEAFKQAESWLDEHLAGVGDRWAFVTCEDWDLMTMMPKQCEMSHQHVPERYKQWINVRDVYQQVTGNKGRGLPQMLKGLGLPLKGRHHSVLDDSRNIASLLLELCRRGSIVRRSMLKARYI